MPEIGKKLVSALPWDQIFEDQAFKKDLEELILPDYVKSCRWFAGKSSTIKHVRIQNRLELKAEVSIFYILIIEVQFKEAFSHQYLLPMALVEESGLSKLEDLSKWCRLSVKNAEGAIYDALYISEFRDILFENISKGKNLILSSGYLKFEKADSFPSKSVPSKSSKILKAEHSNTAIIYHDQYFFKWFRRVFPESNPDLEISRYLNSNHFKHTAQYLGSMSWVRPEKPPISFGLLQDKLQNEGDAWVWMLKEVNQFFQQFENSNPLPFNYYEKEKLFEPIKPKNLAPNVVEVLGKSLIDSIILIGRRTAQMHLALASDHSQTDFMPVPFNPDYSVWLKNKVTYLFDLRIGLLEKNIGKLRGLAKDYGQTFLDKRNEVLEEILSFDESKLCSMRTRVHGDYHLGQVLIHNHDFYILDFEGEPESTIRDRKVKQSPLKDVAGMLRSFHYAIYATLFDEAKKWSIPQQEQFEIAERFYQLICGLFMHGFTKTAVKGGLDIGYKPEIYYLLRYHLLEKAVYELGYELNSRPAWAIIPLRGIMRIMNY
ncbi:MAG: trehalose synthase [Saprospiraceae bacterium]